MIRLLRASVVAVVVLAPSSCHQARCAPDSGPKAIRCVLTADGSTWQPGKTLSCSVRIANESGKDIYLARVLDGSLHRMRYPHCYFEITDPDGQDGQVLEVRCGNKNRLRVADLVPVPAGGKFDPYARGLEGGLYRFSDETFRKPGRYRLRFVYSTDGTNWDGDLGEKPTQEEALEIARRLKLVPKVTIKSNDLVIESLAGNPGK